jgi:hypothetical protein
VARDSVFYRVELSLGSRIFRKVDSLHPGGASAGQRGQQASLLRLPGLLKDPGALSRLSQEYPNKLIHLPQRISKRFSTANTDS